MARQDGDRHRPPAVDHRRARPAGGASTRAGSSRRARTRRCFAPAGSMRGCGSASPAASSTRRSARRRLARTAIRGGPAVAGRAGLAHRSQDAVSSSPRTARATPPPRPLPSPRVDRPRSAAGRAGIGGQPRQAWQAAECAALRPHCSKAMRCLLPSAVTVGQAGRTSGATVTKGCSGARPRRCQGLSCACGLRRDRDTPTERNPTLGGLRHRSMPWEPTVADTMTASRTDAPRLPLIATGAVGGGRRRLHRSGPSSTR